MTKTINCLKVPDCHIIMIDQNCYNLHDVKILIACFQIFKINDFFYMHIDTQVQEVKNNAKTEIVVV